MEDAPFDKCYRHGKRERPLIINDVPGIAVRDDIVQHHVNIGRRTRGEAFPRLRVTEHTAEFLRYLKDSVRRPVYFPEERNQRFRKAALHALICAVKALLQRLPLQIFKDGCILVHDHPVRAETRVPVQLRQQTEVFSHPSHMPARLTGERYFPDEAHASSFVLKRSLFIFLRKGMEPLRIRGIGYIRKGGNPFRIRGINDIGADPKRARALIGILCKDRRRSSAAGRPAAAFPCDHQIRIGEQRKKPAPRQRIVGSCLVKEDEPLPVIIDYVVPQVSLSWQPAVGIDRHRKIVVGIGIIECRFVKPRFRKQLLQFRFCKCPDTRRIRVPGNAVEVAPRMVLRTARKVFQAKPVRNGYEKHTVFRKMHADEAQ